MGTGLYQSNLGIGSGFGNRVSYDGKVEYLAGGLTIDWSTVTAVSADTTLNDGTFIPNGGKYLRYGQCLAQIGTAAVYTFTLTGGPTSGSAIFEVPALGNKPAERFTIAYNDTAAIVLATLQNVSRFGASSVSVTRSGAGSNADPYIFTVTLDKSIYITTPTLVSHTFTGGTTPTGTVGTTTAAGTSNGMWGPYDSGASDGRQTTPAAGVPFCVLDVTVMEKVPNSFTSRATNFAAGIVGGNVFRDRIIHTTGTHSLAAGPTRAELLAALPRLVLVKNF